jgi:hypothetical protein
VISALRALAFILCCSLAGIAHAQLPAQWQSGGYHHAGFEVASDVQERFHGHPSLLIRSTASIAPDGEATAGTGFLAGKYRGKRVRFSAYLKSVEVAGWGGLWMRVNAPASAEGGREQRLRFDNMRNRPVKGTSFWVKYEIVLDIPVEASDIALGFFLVGAGQIWMSSPSVDVVGPEIPVTSNTGKNLPAEPQLDLSFQ